MTVDLLLLIWNTYVGNVKLFWLSHKFEGSGLMDIQNQNSVL